MKKIIFVILFIIAVITLVAFLKFNLSDSDIYVQDSKGNMVPVSQVEKNSDTNADNGKNNDAMMPVESDGGIGDGAPNLDDLISADESGTAQFKNFSAVPPQSFQELYQTGEFIAVDVRTPGEISQGKVIKDSLEIDFYAADFREQLAKLDKNKKYLIICRSGSRSGKAVQMMKEMGFKEVYDLAGGVIAWQDAGFKLSF